MQAPAKAPAKAPVIGLQHEPEDDFQYRTHQNLYFSGRENPSLSGLGLSLDNTAYIGIWNGFHGNVDFLGKPMKITFSLIIFHADTSYLGQIMTTIWGSLKHVIFTLR